MKPIFVAAAAAHGLVKQAEAARETEDGGVVLVHRPTGDVVAYVPTPPETSRSAVHVTVGGAALDHAVLRALHEQEDATLGGYAHVHIVGPEGLSGGDVAQLLALHGDPRLPDMGVTAVLAVKHEDGRTRLRAWRTAASTVIEELEVHVVEDVRRARAGASAPASPSSHPAPAPLDEGGRLAHEFSALEAAGYSVDADVTPHGLKVELGHAAARGELLATVPFEGWQMPPRVELRAKGTTSLVTAKLAPFFSGWSSALSLVDLAEHARAARIWPSKRLFSFGR